MGLIYLGLDFCYRDTFACGTYINGKYCTGLTPEEADALLREDCTYNEIHVVSENTGLSLDIDLSDCNPQPDYLADVSAIFSEQKKSGWLNSLFTQKEYNASPVFTFNKDRLNEKLDSFSLLNPSENPEVEMDVTEDGISLTDNMHFVPDTEAIRNAILKAVSDMDDEVVIGDEFFHDIEHSEEQNEIISEYDSLKNFLKARINYRFGNDTETVDEDVLYSFLMKDDSGKPSVDPDTGEYVWDDSAIEAWVDEIADKYDTVGKTRQFKATGGYEVTVEGGTYGNEIDITTEKEYLKSAVRDGISEDHEPAYLKKAKCQGVDDIGDTYVEVNLTEQKLYYYENGVKLIDTPVVTGNMARKCDTPSGTDYVYFKQKNRTLIGENYQTFVHYWIAVVGHIGIHDSTWRSEYGNDIYLTDGSHGCVNTPIEEVSSLYDMVEIGTPVIMFYLDDDNPSDVSE